MSCELLLEHGRVASDAFASRGAECAFIEKGASMLAAATLFVVRGKMDSPTSDPCDSESWFATTSLSAAAATSRVLIITKKVPGDCDCWLPSLPVVPRVWGEYVFLANSSQRGCGRAECQAACCGRDYRKDSNCVTRSLSRLPCQSHRQCWPRDSGIAR